MICRIERLKCKGLKLLTEELPVLNNTEAVTLPVQPDLSRMFSSPELCGLGDTKWNGENGCSCDGGSLAPQESTYWKPGN